jgi:agmatine deiminase
VNPRTVVTAVEPDPRDENHGVLADNRRRLARARDAQGRPFTIVELPMPSPVVHEGQRLPATYVNFYFVNGALLVPTFGDRVRDRQAVATLQRLTPDRRVVGVDCRSLIWGLGAIHCLTQQQPYF